jgi:hypothetical protein
LTETVVPDRTIGDIAATLEALHAQFTQIPGIEQKALTRLGEAKDEAAKAEPVPSEITALVDQATRYATTAAGFAGAVEQLAPHLKRVWDWAGAALPDWVSTVGLR